jgi:hypothetical protein
MNCFLTMNAMLGTISASSMHRVSAPSIPVPAFRVRSSEQTLEPLVSLVRPSRCKQSRKLFDYLNLRPLLHEDMQI